MKRTLVRLLAVLMFGLIPATGLVTPASAVTKVQLAEAASRAAFEPVTGGQFKQVRKIYPKHLNWSTDGCSVPKAITVSVSGMGLVSRYYSRVFHDSCVRHDFGYRNFGRNASGPGPHPKLGANSTTKARIDKRFLNNMKIQCAAKYHNFVTKKACNAAAGTFYLAVVKGGKKAFFG